MNEYKGFKWELNSMHTFRVAIPDPDGGQHGLKDFETYKAMAKYLDKELSTSTKKYPLSLSMILYSDRDSVITPGFKVTNINRTSGIISGKGGVLGRNKIPYPETPQMMKLLEALAKSQKQTKRLENLADQFDISYQRYEPGRRYRSGITHEGYEAAVKVLEAEYAEKKALAEKFDLSLIDAPD